MMSRISLRRLALVSTIASLISAAAIIACSSQTTVGENVATTSAPLTVGTNHDVTGSLHLMHETSVVSASYGLDGQLVSHWVVGFNNCVPDNLQGCQNVDTIAGWATSSDVTGLVWTAHTQTAGGDFGTPGELGARSQPTAGGTFAGWRGDPSLAVVTDPALSNGGRRVIYANIGNSSLHPSSDIVVALSDTGGETWGHAQFANEPTNGGSWANSQHTVWDGVDEPKLASNRSAPYGTYVAWVTGSGAYINKISYANDFAVSLGMPVWGQAVKIPPAQLGGQDLPIWHPTLIPFTHTSCKDATPHEALYVVWADGGMGRCPENVDSGSRMELSTTWHSVIYDTLDGWSGPWTLEADSAWPNCVGFPITNGNGRVSSNLSNPAIAYDYLSETFWVAHTQGTAYGTRVSVLPQSFVCQGGTLVPTTGPGVAWRPSTPCYNTAGCTPGGPNGADGGIVVNDEWGPAMAFMLDETTVPPTSRLIVTWYDTRFDIGNRLVQVWGTESRDDGISFDAPVTVSKPGTGQTIPWDHTLAGWWDYQSIGIDKVNGRFLDAWGGDARLGAPSLPTCVRQLPRRSLV